MTLKYINRLQSKRILIINGGSGIGFEIAGAVLEHGASVCINAKDYSELGKAVLCLRSIDCPLRGDGDERPRVTGKAFDLFDSDTRENNLETLLDFATDEGEQVLDHVVLVGSGEIMDRDRPAAGNIVLSIELAKLLPRYMKQCQSSSITLVAGASAANLVTNIKWDISRLAVDLKPVRVNAVAWTFITSVEDEEPSGQSNGVQDIERLMQHTALLDGPVTIDEVEVYLYCMRNEGISGQVLRAGRER